MDLAPGSRGNIPLIVMKRMKETKRRPANMTYWPAMMWMVCFTNSLLFGLTFFIGIWLA